MPKQDKITIALIVTLAGLIVLFYFTQKYVELY